MSATFNWSYKNGFNNKYNLTVPSTVNDSTRPTGYAYVAPWGNDTTGNGSRQLPYRTIVKGCTISGAIGLVILAPGVYRENLTSLSTNNRLYGDGNVILDGTLITATLSGVSSITFLDNITLRGYTSLGVSSIVLNDCIIYGLQTINGRFANCIFKDCDLRISSLTNIAGISNCTFYKSNILHLTSISFQTISGNIYSDCNVSFASSPLYIDFSLFFNCNFRFNASTLAGTTYYPSVPSGYTYITDITTLRAANVTAFGAATYNFNNCAFGDPLFNNVSILDFSLAATSPAKNRTYFGNYAGAVSIASKLAVTTNALTSAFDNSSAVNLTIAADSLTLTDVNLPASIVAKPVANLSGRVIGRPFALGFYSDRNGEFISSILNLSASTLSAGAVPINTPYQVEVGSITYNGNVYTAGERFTSASSSLSFTTSTSGVIREILQAPSRETVEIRFNDGTTATITNSGTIVTDTWYYVISGSATYNGNTYAAGDFFKGVGGFASFTGTAVLRPTFVSADAYFVFEAGTAVTTNNTGNVRTGAIVRGNGDAAFDRTPANIFSVNYPFIQIKYSIQAANLTSQ